MGSPTIAPLQTPLQDRQKMVRLGHGKRGFLPVLLLLLVLPYSISYPQSLEDLMAGSLAREAYLGRQDLRYQLAEPDFWANIKHHQQDQGYRPVPILESVPIKRGSWKRKPRYVSNYADAVFRGLG